MPITTYSDLQTSVADYLDRSDMTSVIPTWIDLAEAQFQRVIRDRRMLQRSTADVDSQFTQLPSDFLEMLNIQLNGSTIQGLEYRTPSALDAERPFLNQYGKPIFFSIVGETLEVLPNPNGTAYTTELLYYQKIPALSDSNTSNWLLTNHPDVYLFGTLKQSAPYLKNDERLTVWSALYQQAVEELRVQDDRSQVYTSRLSLNFRGFPS
jgi:hypothetical protein